MAPVVNKILQVIVIAQHILNTAWQLILFISLKQKNRVGNLKSTEKTNPLDPAQEEIPSEILF